jgi:hypothetical protein
MAGGKVGAHLVHNRSQSVVELRQNPISCGNILADRLYSVSSQIEVSLENLSGNRLKGGEARLPVEPESSHREVPIRLLPKAA